MREGESLASIAAALWGDGSLWYQIADINGLTANSALSEGQILVLPAGVLKQTHNSKTFTPYDSNSAIGDTSPTTPIAPKPGRGKNCGIFGQILLAVIAIAVVVITKNVILGKEILGSAFLANATAAAAGSIVSQSVGVATGIQDKFSWNAVGLAAISAGVTGSGIGDKFAKTAGFVGGAGQTMVAAGVNSAISQGIGVATGMQEKFSWAGVAGAAVGAGAAQFASSKLPGAAKFDPKSGALISGPTFANRFGASMASGIANATMRTLIDGTDFGDNILAALPDIIGQTIGEMVAGGIAGRNAQKPMTKEKIIPASAGDKARDIAAQADAEFEHGLRLLDRAAPFEPLDLSLEDGGLSALGLDGEDSAISGLWTDIDTASSGDDWILRPPIEELGFVAVPRPWGFAPSELREGVPNFHTYTFEHQLIGAEKLPYDVMREILRENPVPDPIRVAATVDGSVQSATFPVPLNQVRSYERLTSTNKYVVINVTDGLNHALAHGWVMSTLQTHSDGSVWVLTYGEGNSYLQGNNWLGNGAGHEMNQAVWDARAQNMQQAVDAQLAARGYPRRRN